MARRAAAEEVEPEPATAGDDEGGSEESRMREIVRDVLAELHITGDTPPGDDEGGGDGETAPAGGRRTQAAIEDDVESRVRAAIGKLRTEEERDSRLSALEEQVATATPERAPIKERVSTRVMGWNRGTR